MTPDPAKEYEARRARWKQRGDDCEILHRRTGNLRLLLAAGLIVVAVLLRQIVPVGFLFCGVFAGIFVSGMFHDRIIEKRDTARRLAAFYERGLDRIGDRWAGKGSAGTEFLDKQHPYAIDLDVFGTGGLFELVNTSQTQAGQAWLARWLLKGADDGEIAERQKSAQEMKGKLDLREEVAGRASDPQAHIDTDALVSWAAQPLNVPGAAPRLAALCLPLLAWFLLLMGEFSLWSLAFSAQCLFAGFHKRRTARTFSLMKLSASELRWLSETLGLLEREPFQAPRSREIQSRWNRDGVWASAGLRRLASWVDWVDSSANFFLALAGPFFLFKTQVAFALEAWRAKHGPRIGDWLSALGEMEALCSLGGYACEHPTDIFPELIVNSASPSIEAQGLAHPLIAQSSAVRNDLLLDAHEPLHVISGSNMSGKSTWLRAIGANLVLALAGAPVRARAFRMTSLRIGASIRPTDSLQEGVSRFYAEIQRLRQILELTGQRERTLFLIDEILSGTNSHDREIGAAFIVKALVNRGAVGLITTHDLALTRIVEEVKPPGANFHFQDQLAEGKLTFDYQLRPGVVTKSNALDLMRSIGLNV